MSAPIAAVLGAGLAAYTGADVPRLIVTACVLAGASVTVSSFVSPRYFVFLCVGASGLVAMCASMQASARAAAASFYGITRDDIVALHGILASDPAPTARGGERVVVSLSRVESETGALADARGTVLAFFPDDAPDAGRSVVLFGRLGRLSSADLDSFTVAAYRIKPYAGPIGYGRGFALARIERRIARLPTEIVGFFRAVFLGRRDGLLPELENAFRVSGAMHLLALSGMHLAVISGLVGYLGGIVLGRGRGWVISVTVAALYIAVVGPRPSLVRAGVMVAVFALARVLGRRPRGVDVLAAAVFLILVFSPSTAHDLGFQLSVAALAGILVFGAVVDQALIPWIPNPVRASFAASVGAQLCTAPIVASGFGVLYPVGVFTAIVLGFPVVVFLALGLVFLVNPISLLDGLIARTMNITFAFLVVGVRFFSGFRPWSVAPLPASLPLFVGVLGMCVSSARRAIRSRTVAGV